jgi:hypothetical protein
MGIIRCRVVDQRRLVPCPCRKVPFALASALGQFFLAAAKIALRLVLAREAGFFLLGFCHQRQKNASSRMMGSGMPISQSSAPLPKPM